MLQAGFPEQRNQPVALEFTNKKCALVTAVEHKENLKCFFATGSWYVYRVRV